MNAAKALRGSARKAVRKGGLILSSAFVLSFAVNLLRLGGPFFMILVYDRVLTSRSMETLIALFSLLIVLLMVLGTLDYARKRLLARFGAQFQEQMEETLLRNSGRNHVFQHNKSKPAVGLDEVDGLRGFFHSGSLIAVFDFIWTPMFLTVVFFLHPLLGWACVAGVALIGLLALIKAVFMGGRRERARESAGAVATLRSVLIASRETVRGQDMGVGFRPRWQKAREDARDDAIALKDWTGWFDSMSKVTVMVVRYSVLATGAYLTLNGVLTVGAMVAATFLVTRILGPVDRFFTQIPQMFQARDHWQRLNAILATRAEELEDEYAEQPGALHQLMLDNVSVRSPLTGKLILRSVSLVAEAGEIIEINGLSSQGKTVLMETILGMWSTSSGAVLVGGRHSSRLTDADARKLFGYAPDNPSFVAGTIEENISGLDTEATPDAVSLAARRARMHAAISSLPDGYKTMLDARGNCLSSFERYQLGLARAFYGDPKILLIDGLDSDMMVRIPKKLKVTFNALKNNGTTIILTSRDPLDLSYVDRRFQLKDGKLTEMLASGAMSKRQVTAKSKVEPPAKETEQRPNVSVLRDMRPKESGKTGTR
ncbi:ATP-binding cassette domain-containing protein [Ruegeria pomeroyi]|nr:ATP-binding cassette domain-containing protein [Ruegeria pomeroyi]